MTLSELQTSAARDARLGVPCGVLGTIFFGGLTAGATSPTFALLLTPIAAALALMAGGFDGSGYGTDTMAAGWDNVVSSAKSFTGCSTFRHWEYTYHAGASQNCNPCYEMGAMNDRTSSLEWGP